MVNELSDRSNAIINFFHEFKYIDNKKILLDKKTNKFLYYTYNILKEANSKLLKMEYSPEISIVNSKLLSNENNYISNKIQSYINHKAMYKIKYKWQKNERNVDLVFIVFSDKDVKNIDIYNRYAHNVFLILDLLFIYSNKKCSQNQEINIYMTPFKRELPTNKSETILSPIHINGGSSYVCPKTGNIIIFREQEWFKVLIHESFHNLGFDFSDMNLDNFNKKIYEIFPLKSDFNIFEAYCEFWALTLNVIISSFLLTNNLNNYKTFLEKFKKYMQIEQNFTYLQVGKILNYMNLDYIDLFGKEKNNVISRENYKENTNVFSYYICKMILLYDYDSFIVWCIKNNNNVFDFNKTDKGLNNFLKYILNNYNSCYIINNIKILSKTISNEKKKSKTRKILRKNREKRGKLFDKTSYNRSDIYRKYSKANKRKIKTKKIIKRGLSLTSIEII